MWSVHVEGRLFAVVCSMAQVQPRGPGPTYPSAGEGFFFMLKVSLSLILSLKLRYVVHVIDSLEILSLSVFLNGLCALP